jgi:uncharacterized protein (TIGR03000 family)
MKRQLLRFLPALALLGVLAIPTVSEAQFGFSIGSGGYGRGSGWGSGGYGRGYGSGWGGYGPGSGYGRGWGGSGFSIGGPGFGYYSNQGGRWGDSSGLYLNLGNRSNYGYGYPGGYGYSSPSYSYATPSYGYGYSSPSYSYSTPVYSSGQVYAGGSTGANYQQSFYPPSQGVQTDSSRAYIRVNVPADAEVLFNGTATNQRGTMRMFQSPPLDANNNYSYEITARWMENGQERKQTRTVQLQPGSTVDVSFTGQQGGQSGDLNNNQPNRTDSDFDQPNRPNQQPLNQPNRPNNNLNQPNQPNINQPNQPNNNRPNQPNNVNQPNQPGTPPRPQQQQDLTAPDR